MPGPLETVTILDLTSMLSGPWATMILADQGAEVIKVERPGAGDHTRSLGNRRGGFSSSFLNLNRNKRSIALDLKHPDGKAALLDLARAADVLVQNFRPGVADRLGLGYDAVRAVAPEIIYVSISGFGETGPWAHKPVYDPIIQALSGLTTIQAGSDEARPRLVRTVLPDKLSAVMAAQAITAALFSRAETGAGQHVRLSMLDAVMSFLWASDYAAQTYPDRPTSNQAAASFIDLIYETKDGYMTVAVMGDKEWRGLIRAFDKPEWLTDQRFATAAARDRNIDARLEMTQAVLRTRTTDEWLRRLEAEGVPCAPALTRSQAIAHPQVQASKIIEEHTHPEAGRLRQTRNAARFEGTPAAYRKGAPRLGEDGVDLLRGIGYDQARIDRLRAAGILDVAGDEDSAARPTAAE